MHDSGQLVAYKIAVRYLNGTVWLQGHVHDQAQLDKAVALVFATKGVTINQVIRDELTIDGVKSGNPANPPATKTIAVEPRWQTRCVPHPRRLQRTSIGPRPCHRRFRRCLPPRPW